MRWTVNAGNLTTSHQISGTGKLFKYGSSNLTLSNSQSYTGDTEVYSGTLINNSTLSDSTDLILTEGNYTANATDTVASISTSNSSSTLTIASGQTLTASSSSNTTFAGIIQSSGNFTKAGSGTLTLTGANTYTGNTTISAGNIIEGGQRRSMRIIGEVEDPKELKKIVVKSEKGATYLGDIANITFEEKDVTSYARSYGQKVVLLHVKKRGGKNLIKASKKIETLVDEIGENFFPKDLKLSISNDLSLLKSFTNIIS